MIEHNEYTLSVAALLEIERPDLAARLYPAQIGDTVIAGISGYDDDKHQFDPPISEEDAGIIMHAMNLASRWLDD